MYFDGISDLLDGGIAVHGLGYACDGLPTLPVGEKAIIGGVQTRDVDCLLALPIEVKAKSWSRTKKHNYSEECSRWPSHPACWGKGCFMRRARGVPEATLSLCPTRKRRIFTFSEKTISWTWCVLEIGFSPCLSRKRPFQVSPRRLRSALGLPRL